MLLRQNKITWFREFTQDLKIKKFAFTNLQLQLIQTVTESSNLNGHRAALISALIGQCNRTVRVASASNLLASSRGIARAVIGHWVALI